MKSGNGLFLSHSGNSTVIQLSNGANATINDSLFRGNNGSGAIMAQDSVLRIQSCNFTSNHFNKGAAISMHVSSCSKLGAVTENCKIVGFGYGPSLMRELGKSISIERNKINRY